MKFKKVKITVDQLEGQVIWDVWEKNMNGEVIAEQVAKICIMEQWADHGPKLSFNWPVTLNLRLTEAYALYAGLMGCPMPDEQMAGRRNVLADKLAKLANIAVKNVV